MDIETNSNFEEEEEIPQSFEDISKIYNYGSHEFWENRYIEYTSPFEWYFGWPHIESKIHQFIEGKSLSLNLGCGNSEMAFDIQKSGIKTVVNIDVSKSVIDQMKEKYKGNDDLLWFQMDCTDMDFKDDLFDIVFDKGTFDAILCGENGVANVIYSMSEIWRVLKNDGIFIEISHTDPKRRMILFSKSDESWKFIDPIEIAESELGEEKKRHAYIYIFQKIVKDDEEKK